LLHFQSWFFVATSLTLLLRFSVQALFVVAVPLGSTYHAFVSGAGVYALLVGPVAFVPTVFAALEKKILASLSAALTIGAGVVLTVLQTETSSAVPISNSTALPLLVSWQLALVVVGMFYAMMVERAWDRAEQQTVALMDDKRQMSEFLYQVLLFLLCTLARPGSAAALTVYPLNTLLCSHSSIGMYVKCNPLPA
jgi:hypothetical protein